MRRWLIVWLLFFSSVYGAYVEELKWSKGETFLTFLEKSGLPSSIYYRLDKEEQELAAEIVAGIRYQVLRSEENALEQVLIPIGEELQMHLKKRNGEFIMEIIPIVFQEERHVLSVEVKHSIHSDIIKQTNNYTLANEFTRSFRAPVNLRTLQKGDKVVIVYEQKRRLGKQFGSVKIDVSMVETAKKEHYVFWYKDNYYDAAGKELENFLLGNPVNYTRISSPFSPKRFHPVLKTYRAHLGIDYAASKGTPVRAAGDAKVLYVGNKGGYGKTIELSHSSDYKTLYGHLNGYARGLRKGQTIKKGTVIGYVGNTGLSTGPHLHFGLYRNNVAINPATVVKIAKNILKGNELKTFLSQSAKLKEEAQKAIKDPRPPVFEENFDLSHSLEKSV